MSKTSIVVTSAIVAVALTLPSSALAQRARSGGETSEGGGSAGGRTSSEPSIGTAQPRSAPAPAPSAPSGGSSTSGYGGATSGVNGSRSTATSERTSTTRTAAAGSRVASRDPRSTGLQAQPRPAYQRPRGGDSTVSYYPYFGVGRYSAYNYYDPWYYGATGFGWNPWGYSYSSWHSPFLYGPHGYYSTPHPYYWGHLSDRESWSGDDAVQSSEPSGSLRLRVSPREAKVYVDGALAGVVDEFDGLTNHLRLPAGQHQIELRAEGYQTLALEVTVQDGKTRTERASLKRR